MRQGVAETKDADCHVASLLAMTEGPSISNLESRISKLESPSLCHCEASQGLWGLPFRVQSVPFSPLAVENAFKNHFLIFLRRSHFFVATKKWEKESAQRGDSGFPPFGIPLLKTAQEGAPLRRFPLLENPLRGCGTKSLHRRAAVGKMAIR